MNSKTSISANQVPLRSKISVYPEPFTPRMEGREKRCLSEVFCLKNITVNLTRLKPGAVSALRHYHSASDEFVYILKGTPTLVTNEGKEVLEPGVCCGFKAGVPNGHHLVNESNEPVLYLEAGDNAEGDTGEYPDDDLKASLGKFGWEFTHKDGRAYGE